MNCKNCNEELSGNEQFCSNCGQKNIDRLTLKYLFANFIDDFFNVDSKFLKTIKYLVLKPGYLSKEFMEGKRAAYVPPIRLYVVLSVLFFFLISIVNINQTNEETNVVKDSNITFNGKGIKASVEELAIMELDGTLDAHIDSVTEGTNDFTRFMIRKLAYAKINGNSFTDVLLNQISLFLLLFIPLLALMYGVCFSRKMHGYIGHLVFNLHLNSFIILILSIDRLIRPLINTDMFDLVWSLSIFTIGQIYLIRATMLYYQRKWWVALYKYPLLIFGYTVLALVFLIMVIMSSLIVS